MTNICHDSTFVQLTPLQLTVAYSTIASGGVFHKPFLISRVENHEGRVIEEKVVSPSLELDLPIVILYKYEPLLVASCRHPVFIFGRKVV